MSTAPGWCAETVARQLPDVADAGLWLALLDADGRLALLQEVAEGVRHVDVLFVRDLAATLTALALPTVVLVVGRADGRPRRSDRQLQRDLTRRLLGGSVQAVELHVVASAPPQG